MDESVKQFNKLLKRVSKGDTNALEAIYQQYVGLFFAMAKKYLYNKNLAEDLISEVLIKIVKYSKSFDEKQNGLNWVFKIIHNKAIDFNKLEAKNRTENIDDFYNLSEVIADEDNCIEDDELTFALKQLTDEENRIIYMIFWEGLTVREVSKQLNQPKSNIQYKKKKALESLAKTLSGGAVLYEQ